MRLVWERTPVHLTPIHLNIERLRYSPIFIVILIWLLIMSIDKIKFLHT